VSGQRIRPTTDDDRDERMPRIDRGDAESLAGPRDTLCRAGTDGRTGLPEIPAISFPFPSGCLISRCEVPARARSVLDDSNGGTGILMMSYKYMRIIFPAFLLWCMGGASPIRA
jgi:hypothetical protein